VRLTGTPGWGFFVLRRYNMRLFQAWALIAILVGVTLAADYFLLTHTTNGIVTLVVVVLTVVAIAFEVALPLSSALTPRS
jgi:hypothetical protein